MSLELLINRKRPKSQGDIPCWVSKENASYKAYQIIHEARAVRLNYINSHSCPKDYKVKKNYQISAREIARNTGVSLSTLTSTSSYSKHLKDYLAEVNLKLEQAKDKKLQTNRNTRMNGAQQRKKNELFQELQETRTQLEQLQQHNAVQQVQALLAKIPPPIKRKLGLDV